MTDPSPNHFARSKKFFASLFANGDVKLKCAKALFQTVEMEYRGLDGMPGRPDDPKATEMATALLAKYEKERNKLTIADAILFERMLIRLLPVDSLRRKASQLRDRFRRLIEPEEYQLYLESGPPDPLNGPESALRTDLDEILNRIFYIYTISPFREEMKTRISLRIAILLAGFLGVIAAVALYATTRANAVIPAILPVIVVGAIGGFVSIQQRIQSTPTEGDAIRGVLSLYDGWFSVYLSPLTGSISAAVIYMLFAAGFLKGTLFPDMTSGTKAGDITNLRAFLESLEPNGGVEYAKLLIWGFVSGFAERLVPDTLNRLVSSIQAGAQAKPPAVVESRTVAPASVSSRNGADQTKDAPVTDGQKDKAVA